MKTPLIDNLMKSLEWQNTENNLTTQKNIDMLAELKAMKQALNIAVVSESFQIKDFDIATVEALHDLLLDRENFPLNHPTLRSSRQLTSKLYKMMGYNSR